MEIQHLTPEARRAFEALLPLLSLELKELPHCDQQLFVLRLKRYFQDLFDGLQPIYGRREEFGEFLGRLAVLMARHYRDRPEELKTLDIERELTPDWFQRETMLGYVFYVERFAGTLKGIEQHLPYLEELGVTYLHLMSCLRPREGENDGGFAIADYRNVEAKLGSIDDLEGLCRTLRQRGISVCIDLVLNHCAKEHEWAMQARRGEARFQDYFYTFPDRTIPDQYEKTLPEIFPDFAPGNFSYYPEIDKWVWTTFNEYQWDLNWTNPEVFLEITDIMFYLANKGVEVFRLDAVAFMWKRLGTNCQNQPEVYDLLQALRSCAKITTPAVAHKAEAIVSPDDLIKYFGVGKRFGKVSQLAYHNSLMVQYWSSLASRDTRLMTYALSEFPRTPPNIAWGTYLRCHDDIGWAVTDDDAEAVKLNGFAHRSFLSDFYAGQFPESFARGEVFQHNPQTGDRRISGTLASLAGLELALVNRDERQLALAIERMLLGYALICGFGGLPLLYMGDEVGLHNDYRYRQDHDLAGDNRWLHRPFMDWAKAALRQVPNTVERRLYQGIIKIIRARQRTPHLNSSAEAIVLESGNPALFAYVRHHPLGSLVGLYNFSERFQQLSTTLLSRQNIKQPYDQLEQRFVEVGETLTLAPYQRLWLI